MSDISDVRQIRFILARSVLQPVTIYLRSASDLGVKIVFLPKLKFSGLIDREHPVVRELKELARKKGARLKPQ